MRSKAELNSQKAAASVLQNQIAEVDAQLRSLAMPENELRNIQMQVESGEGSLKALVQKLEEARLSEDMNRLKMTNIKIIEAAMVPTSAIKPRTKLHLLLGIALGLLAGFLSAIFAEFLNQTITTSRQAELRLGVPVLAVIPFERVCVMRR